MVSRLKTLIRGSGLGRNWFVRVLWIAAGLLAACGTQGGSSNIVPQISTEPERADIINAVRRGVNGKTYTEQVTRWETVQRACSQIDVDTDIYMPNNPELARCPYVGATYSDQRSYTESVTQQCNSLPEPSPSWSIQEMGSGRWRVGYGESEWNVELVSGGSANLGELVQVSGYQFVITADHPC